MGLSDGHTYALIAVCRKANQVPELKTAIEQGLINVSQARRITSVITPENQAEWIEKAATLTQRQLEQEIVKVRPKEAVKEDMRPVAPQRVKLVVGISEELMKSIERVKDLEAQRKRKNVTLEEALQELVSFYIEHRDPVKRAERALAKPAPQSPPSKEDKPLPPHRTPIPARIKHEVIMRDQGQCTARTPDGKRCEQRRWVDAHHIVPVAQGGANTASNISSLCFHHHKLQHELSVLT